MTSLKTSKKGAKKQQKTATVMAVSSTHMEVQITREKKTKQQC
jgi:hypothetical protein